MKLIFDKQLKNFFKQYNESLKDYPISSKRRKNVSHFKSYLHNLEKPMQYPICDKKDLGQSFDEDGNPILDELRQNHYQDESVYQWRFSFFQDGNDKIRIYVIKGANEIEESEKRILERYENSLRNLLY